MKKKMFLLSKCFFIALLVFFLSHEAAFAQDALASVKVNIQHVKLSNDGKTISYDVFLQDNNTIYDIAVPGFLFRMAVPQTDIGTNGKTVVVTNATSELGATAATMITSGTNWLMKFKSDSLVTSYSRALILSDTFPGTRIGTFNITNTDGTAFASTLTFNATYCGDVPTLKTTVSVFVPNTTTLASNSAEAQPSTNFSGLGSYTLSAIMPLTISAPTLTLIKIYDGTTTAAVTAGTLSGVNSSDEGNIAVSATATYDDANVGTGKKITVIYTLTGTNVANYKAPADYVVTTGEIGKRFTVKAYLESLWNSDSKTMNKCKTWDDDVQGIVDKFSDDIVDTLRIELHSPLFSNIAYTINNLELHQDGTITSAGSQSIKIPLSITGSYYITIKSRNQLETASGSLISFDGNAIDYDFTDSNSKAFESDPSFSSTKQVGDKWVIYAGDVVSDTDYPEINEGDFYEIFNSRSAKTTTYGYMTLDLNGDGAIDESDLYMAFANRNKYLYIP